MTLEHVYAKPERQADIRALLGARAAEWQRREWACCRARTDTLA